MIHQFYQGQIRRANGIDYIVTDDTMRMMFSIKVECVAVDDLTANQTDPSKCKRVMIDKDDLEWLGDSLEEWVASWNKKR